MQQIEVAIAEDVRRMLLTMWLTRLSSDAAGDSSNLDDFAVRADEIGRVVEVAASGVRVEVDVRTLQRGIEHARVQRMRSEAIKTFLRHEAPVRMMQKLFGMNEDMVNRARKIYGVKPPRRGRPVVPTAQVRRDVERMWHETRDINLVSRFLELHAAFPGLSFATLSSVVESFDRCCDRSLQHRLFE